MKELFKIGIYIGVGFLILGGLLIGIGSKLSNYKVNWSNIVSGTDVDELTLMEGHTEPESISSIDINVDLVKVSFKQGESFRVDYGLYKEMKYNVEVKDGVLIVKNKNHLSLNTHGETKQYINVTYP
ncbi:MAG: hypothetical protein K6G26_06920, partial [Lachnospiraceae bacterium]|nr:hypothetical protein [Lachnospiraceae bacterium]